MKIDLSNTYKTADGHNVRLIERIKNKEYPILGVVIKENGMERAIVWNEEGQACSFDNDNLVEVSEYEDFKVDDKVIVWNDPLNKYKRHFAGVESDKATTFDNGVTSFSRREGTATTSWDNCVLFVEFHKGNS